MKFILSAFLLLHVSVFGQNVSRLDSGIPANIRQQLQNGKQSLNRLDQDQLSKLLKKGSQLPETTEIYDSIAIDPDSAMKMETVDSDTLGIYEKMFQGDTIFPDSMLKKLQIFGHDIFSKTNRLSFTPANDISIPSSYVINVDDEIIIMTWGRINEEYRLKVNRDGTINIPRLGPVSVSGLPFSVMRENLLNRLQQIEGVNASVSVGTLRTIGIFIVGEVNTPGFYTLSALSNIANALYAAGGPSKNGSLRNVKLKRGGKIVSSFDLYDFLLDGDDNSGFRLQAGDVIHVPVIKRMVAVAGNVRRGALYELIENETLDNVIALAGGISPAAWTNKIQIQRFLENKQQTVIDIDTISKEIPPVPVMDGDIIKIFPILEKDFNSIHLTGNVIRPGKFEYKSGMRISDIIPDYNALLPETYLDYAIIIRQDPPRYLNRIIAFNLKSALDQPSSTDNLLLQNRDFIIIYNFDYFEPDRNIEIDGSVTIPGKFKLMENMRIRDLILQAGGLRDDASSTRGELYRRNIDEKNDIVTTIKLDFCVECALQNDSAHNYTLNRLDRVYIRNKLGWEKERKVVLRGQFSYPGTYVLFEGETLGELIERAGGFSSKAFVDAAVFTRVSVRELEQQRIQEYSQQLETDIMNLSAELAAKENSEEAKMMLEQQMMLKNAAINRKSIGRIVIDLKNKKNYRDFILEDGDELFVPRNLNTVSVFGEVYNPSTFKFEPNNGTASYYLEAAGGVKSTSDLRHSYIIKANGNIVTNKTTRVLKEKLSPGDAVMVPKKLKYSNPHKLFVDTVDAIFKISSLITTVILLITTIHSTNN